MARAMMRIRGTYALAVMFKDYPEEIFVARQDNPMIIGVGEGESFIASDVPPLLPYTRKVYYIGNQEIADADIRERLLSIILIREEIQKDTCDRLSWDAEAAEKGGYEHFMIKEIHEQPRAVRDTLNSVIRDGHIDLTEAGLSDDVIRSLKRIYIVACGSAYHAGVAAQYVIEDLARYSGPTWSWLPSSVTGIRFWMRTVMVIVIQPVGRDSRQPGSPASGKETGRSYDGDCQCGRFHALPRESRLCTLHLCRTGDRRGDHQGLQHPAGCHDIFWPYSLPRCAVRSQKKDMKNFLQPCRQLPDKIQRSCSEMTKSASSGSQRNMPMQKTFSSSDAASTTPVSLEGSLKLKEISYIHSEAYAAGELKHGTISLIEDGILVVGVLTQEALYEKTISNMVEVKMPRCVPHGTHNRYGNYNIEDTVRFCSLCTEDRRTFHTELSGSAAAAAGILCKCCEGTGC